MIRTEPQHPFAARCDVPDGLCFEWLTSNLLPSQDLNHFAHILIEPDVFISDWRSAADQRLLSQNRIGYVLSLKEVYGERTSGADKVFSDNRILRVSCFFEDDGSFQDDKVKKAYEQLTKFHEAAYKDSRSLLIHCEAGCSRSPSLLAAFLCLNYHEAFATFKSAVEFISKYRNVSIDPGLARNVCRIFEIQIE